MGLWGSLIATAIIAVLLYVGDRGIAFHLCLYSAIASGRKFTAEQAFREMDNPFATPIKLLVAATLLVVFFFLLGSDGIHEDWEIIVLFAVCLAYGYVCWSAAMKAFQRTSFGNWMRE